MSKKSKRIVVGIFGVLCVLILISMFILGVNLIKNRWHKLNFIVDKITVTEQTEATGHMRYHVVIDGSVKAWFYDFNTYEFDMVFGSGGVSTPINFVKCKDVIANHDDGNKFQIAFDTYNLEDLQNYSVRGENVYVSGTPKEATDIKLFLSEHLDKMVRESN